MKVFVRGFDALVSEPQSDDGDIDARLEQGHGGAVPEDVRRYAFGPQAGARSLRLFYFLAKQQVYSEARQRFASNTGERDDCFLLAKFAEPLLQYPRGARPERDHAVLTTFSMQLDIAF